MPNLQNHRLDELPLDRRIAGEARGLARGPQLGAIFERRDVDPTSTFFKRRTGSRRVTNIRPNLLGVTSKGDGGEIRIDHDFSDGLTESGNEWFMFGTIQVPVTSLTTNSYTQLAAFNDVYLYAYRDATNNRLRLRVYDSSTQLVQTAEFNLSSSEPTTLRFAWGRGASDVIVNAWLPETTPSANVTAGYTFGTTQKDLKFFGTPLNGLTPTLPGIVLNNVRLSQFSPDSIYFDLSAYESEATNTNPDATYLLWHDTFADGGDLLTLDEDWNGDTLFGYLIPSAPRTLTEDQQFIPSVITFGGRGVIEIPFYLDFDEYFWTSTNAAARLNWCFQLKVTTPAVLEESCVFELQDLARLEIIFKAGNYGFTAQFNDGTATVNNTFFLSPGQTYDVFVARDADNCYLKVNTTEISESATNPVVYEYDKTIGFLLGDRVDLQNSTPFSGIIERFALFNDETRAFGDKDAAVLYYNADSIEGNAVLDQGNRALNAYTGYRSDAQSPYYKEGGFAGGTYVAANGGYLISNASPGTEYSGQLRKPLTKDVVVQRRGRRAFMTSNGVSYIIDDQTKTFRPLGIPRPSTKVSATPQGIGPIDGFVRYAYRYVTLDGTVGPAFELDPCDATGGVNVFLGADTFGIPGDPAFGLSYGEAEGDKDTANDEVECFIAKDYDASNNSLLHQEISDPGLTAEVAFRIPNEDSGAKESVISQGVTMPFGPQRWYADHFPKTFPYIGQNFREACTQFSFRYAAVPDGEEKTQILYGVGARSQKYKTGAFNTSTHYRLNHLIVSIQAAGTVGNTTSICVCRDAPAGSSHRDDDLEIYGIDYNFQDGHDYTVFVSRAGSLYGESTGSALTIAVFNHTLDGTPDGGGGTYNGWKLWPHDSDVSQILVKQFYGTNYAGSSRDDVMWGAMNVAKKRATRTRVRKTIGGSFSFTTIGNFYSGTELDGTGGSRMYHGRMWRKDFSLVALDAKGLERYGARNGPLKEELEIDVAFCPDTSTGKINGGWDYPNDMRVKFVPTEANTVLTEATKQTVFFAYGFDNTISAGTPDTHAVTTTSKIPLWAAYTNRNEGSLVVGVGQDSVFELAKRKWHDGSQVQLFTDFANTIDLSEWTWLTMYFSQITRTGTTDTFDVWLERIFIDGNTGDWGDLFNADTSPSGPGGKTENTAAGNGQYTLFTVGGVPGIDTEYEVEIAETRLWNGERYTAEGGGSGTETFGTYLSTRVAPNYWDKLWHYLRFSPLDVNDMEAQATMDQVGTYGAQRVSDAVTIYQGAAVVDGGTVSQSGGSSYFTPFPIPPLTAIRGIQIFRTQVVPVSETFPNGDPNPSAELDAWRACRAAPLYYVTEIPDGTQFYFDNAIDTLLGAELDVNEGLIPANPGGVFEWDNYIGLWDTTRPRIYFSASPDSWESFPTDRIVDLPLREYGPIQAATELASRDARNSRVLVLGKSWGAFIDGSPTAPRTNTLGGGVGAASSRCLVVEKGIAYAYNGTLWAITGDGQVEDIGLPVIDLLPPPDQARLSTSSSLSSLFVINEATGLTLRWHFARREWFVEDRYALSTTDIDGESYWVHVSGYPSKVTDGVYGDDTDPSSGAWYVVGEYNNSANTVTFTAGGGLQIGQRFTLVANEDPRVRATHEIKAISGSTITVDNLNLESSGSIPTGTPGETEVVTYTYRGYVGIGYWGTMLDTGQFINKGALHHVDMGVSNGDRWYAMSEGADFARDPGDRDGFSAVESYPSRIVDDGGSGVSARWGLTARQRIQRIIVWNPVPADVGLSELELNYSND